MTREQRDGKPQSPFSEWARANGLLPSNHHSLMDIDWLWHQWSAYEDSGLGRRTINHIMLIEEKPNEADLTASQRDTMLLIDAALKYADKSHFKARTLRGDVVTVRLWGYFKLRYQGLHIPTAKWIEWNKQRIDEATLVKLLRFELNPRTLKPRTDRRHHKKRYPLLEGGPNLPNS